MATFYIPQLKSFLPILKECYGFDIIEISSELTDSLRPYVDEQKLDEIVLKQTSEGKGPKILWDSALYIDGHIEIQANDNFEKQTSLIADLCNQHIQNENARNEAIFILSFMTAIFSREENKLNSDDIIKRYRKSWNIMHPDWLRLFIALNKPKHKPETPVRICFKNDSPHLIANKEGWFSDFLNAVIKQMLGDITIEEAEQELEKEYSDEKGRKSRDPYLNYIINGTYNYIKRFLDSDNETVTVKQCRFLLEYLKIIGRVKDGDIIANINNLQSTVKSLISYKFTPVEKHIKASRFSLIDK